MADNVKEVTQTPPPTPLNADENRRRTRSQTRNGGISTPPAPIAEPQARKRASQGQAGSANKRGRKAAAQTTTTTTTPQTETVGSPATKETEVHSKQAENQDLSKQKTTETDVKKSDDVEMVSAEEVKSPKEDSKNTHSKQKTSQDEAGAASLQDACPIKKTEAKSEPAASGTKKPVVESESSPAKDDACKLEDKKKKETKKQQNEAVESTDKPSVENCALPKKVEPKASGKAAAATADESQPESKKNDETTTATKVTSGEEKTQTAPVVDEKVQDNNADNALKHQEEQPSANSEPKTTSEQAKIDTSEGKAEAVEKNEKTVNNTADDKGKGGLEGQQIKVQDSGDSKLDSANNDEATKAAERTNSATPV